MYTVNSVLESYITDPYIEREVEHNLYLQEDEEYEDNIYLKDDGYSFYYMKKNKAFITVKDTKGNKEYITIYTFNNKTVDVRKVVLKTQKNGDITVHGDIPSGKVDAPLIKYKSIKSFYKKMTGTKIKQKYPKEI